MGSNFYSFKEYLKAYCPREYGELIKEEEIEKIIGDLDEGGLAGRGNNDPRVFAEGIFLARSFLKRIKIEMRGLESRAN